jgi:hypothetical protein
MIDTDKYKGHEEGEWAIEMNDTGDECAIHAQDYGTIAQTFYRDSDKLFLATTRLIADAPLLLSEVKRLSEENELLRQGIIDATLMYPDLYNDLPLYLRELIE